jgi:hypothetical protein
VDSGEWRVESEGSFGVCRANEKLLLIVWVRGRIRVCGGSADGYNYYASEA